MMKLSDRVQTVRKNAGFTQKELADRIGISQTAIHKLECGRSRSSRRTVAIAIACGVDPIWLETGRGNMISSNSNSGTATVLQGGHSETHHIPNQTPHIPLISWEKAAIWQDINALDLSKEVETWVPVTRQVSKQAFALRVVGDSMESEFSEGDIIIVDPTVPHVNKSFVIAVSEEGRSTFRQFRQDGGQRYLTPLNARYPIQILSDQIVGVVVTKFKEY